MNLVLKRAVGLRGPGRKAEADPRAGDTRERRRLAWLLAFARAGGRTLPGRDLRRLRGSSQPGDLEPRPAAGRAAFPRPGRVRRASRQRIPGEAERGRPVSSRGGCRAELGCLLWLGAGRFIAWELAGLGKVRSRGFFGRASSYAEPVFHF